MNCPHRCRRGEDGFSLVEVLVSLTILGIAFVAIMGGMLMVQKGSDIHRKQAIAQTTLSTAAESVKQSTYLACTSATWTSTASYSPSASVDMSATGWSAAKVSKLRRWNDATGTFVDWWNGSPAAVAPCPAAGDGGLQEVTLSVASLDGRDTESISVVKRAP